MNKEEIESLFKKYKIRIPKEKQGQSEFYECKRHHKYSLTWTSFLYEYEEKYYCFEHIVIILLQQENQELKKKYLNAVSDYETTMSELQELKKQLEKNQNPLKGIFAQVNDDILLRNCGAMQSEIDTYKNQQKEFIEYLENCINELKKESMNKLQNTINLGIVDITKEILSKYKSIIGVANEKNNN